MNYPEMENRRQGNEDVVAAAMLDAAVRWAASLDAVTTIRVIHIEGWFGQKWAGFSGKLVGAVGVHRDMNTGRLAVPPFVPNRVINEACYHATPDGLVPVELAAAHRHMHSETATRRYFDSEFPSTAALWHARVDARMAFMCYAPARPGETLGWYVALATEAPAGSMAVTDSVGLVPAAVLAAVDSTNSP